MSNQIEQLTSQIKPLIQEPGVGNFIALLNAYIEQWKEELVNVKDDDVIKLQGAINKTRGILVSLHRKQFDRTFANGAYNGEGKATR